MTIKRLEVMGGNTFIVDAVLNGQRIAEIGCVEEDYFNIINEMGYTIASVSAKNYTVFYEVPNA